MSVLDYAGKSAHQLKTELRKANIDLKIKDKQLAAAQARIADLESQLADSRIS